MQKLIKLGFGLGDHLSFQVVLRHIQHYYPEWEICLETQPGCAPVFNGMAEAHDKVMPFDYRTRFKKSEHFAPQLLRPERFYPSIPSTKPTRCILEEFDFCPKPEFYYYEIEPRPEMIAKAKEFADNLGPYGIVHYEGVSTPEDKNLSHEEAADMCEFLKSKKLTPVLFDLNGRSPVGRQTGIYHLTGTNNLFDGQRRYCEADLIHQLMSNAKIMFGIDSGPEHIAAATETPTYIVWTFHNPMFCIDPSPNVSHIIPSYQWLFNDDYPEEQRYLKENYTVYEILKSTERIDVVDLAEIKSLQQIEADNDLI
jgi:ADP-heptose:LPS heptosyltransferase